MVREHQKNRSFSKAGTFGLIHLAASSEGSLVLQFLLEKVKENPNEICNNHDRASPLHFAVLSNQFDNARILLRYGAFVN